MAGSAWRSHRIPWQVAIPALDVPSHEDTQPFAPGIGQQRGGVPLLDDCSLVHENNAIGNVMRELHFVGDHDHRHAVSSELLHYAQHFVHELGIQSRCYLVEQHQLGLHRQRPRDGHSLLLAARKAGRVGIGLVGQAHARDQISGNGLGHLPRHLVYPGRPHGDVAQDGHVREQIEALKDEADLGPCCRDFSLGSAHSLSGFGTASAANIARTTRACMLDVLRSDYVRTAAAKGLAGRVVILKHALKNALIPTITVMGLQVGFLIGGAIVVETLFAMPGLGTFGIDAIIARDYQQVQGFALITAIAFVVINLLVDLTYTFLDPRIRYA